MFYYLKGEVALKENNLVALDVSGVGYAVFTSANTLAKLEVSKTAKLFTYCSIREDAFDIFGFYTLEELNFFKLLIGINGVGPKAGLSILSIASPSALALAIITGDEKLITNAQGIGKKIAQRIVLELKDKVAKEQMSTSASEIILNTTNDTGSFNEALSALMVLGYSQAEATSALSGVSLENDTEQIIKDALKKMMN